MTFEKIPDKVEASNLPQIQPDYGARTDRSAEAGALGAMPVDEEDLRRARVLDKTEKSMILEDPQTGKKFVLTKEQYKSIMEAQ